MLFGGVIASALLARNEEGCSRRLVGDARVSHRETATTLGRFAPSFASFGMADIGTVQERAD